MPQFTRLWPLVALLFLQACSSLPPETYTPKLGQLGKDVMWLPTRDELVTQMLAAARVGPNDEVVDLGAGDGKIPIAAARQFGARAWGIEYNKDLAALAQRNAQRARVFTRRRLAWRGACRQGGQQEQGEGVGQGSHVGAREGRLSSSLAWSAGTGRLKK